MLTACLFLACQSSPAPAPSQGNHEAFDREYAKIANVKAQPPDSSSQKPQGSMPFFRAAELAGKTEAQADKILGKPIDAWTARDSSGRMREYDLGEETLAGFKNGKIDSIVIFFGG